MSIIIDTRENKLRELFDDSEYGHKALHIGDIHLLNKQNNLAIIIERKSLNDLLSSITDGRYKEQSFRLNECSLPNHQIYYFIEGNSSQYKDRPNSLYKRSTIYSCLYSLTYTKGFSVICTNNLRETAAVIKQMSKKLLSDSSPPYSEGRENGGQASCNKDYLSVVNITKKSNITKDNINHIMLSQIPGVSKNSAKVILAKHSTIKELIKQLEIDPGCLDDVTYINAKNQKRRISKKCIENIKNFLI